MLPLKNMLVIWPPLMICHDSLSYLLIILTIAIPWINMRLTLEGWKEDTSQGNMMRKDATKIRSSISPGALINTINVVTVLGFLWLIQRRGLASCNINILWNRYSVDWCVCLTSILYFTCLTSICDCFIPVPLITPCSNPYILSGWNFELVLFCWLL